MIGAPFDLTISEHAAAGAAAFWYYTPAPDGTGRSSEQELSDAIPIRLAHTTKSPEATGYKDKVKQCLLI